MKVEPDLEHIQKFRSKEFVQFEKLVSWWIMWIESKGRYYAKSLFPKLV